MFSNINKKLMTYLIIAVVAVVGIFVVIGVISMFKGNRLSFSKLESKLESAAVSYYEDHNDALPKLEGENLSIDATTLIEAGEIKSFDKIAPKGSTCTGEVVVEKNGDFYLYTPYLDCGEDYKTVNLIDKIKENNPVTTTGDGLYQIGDNLVFRGERVNNYVSFSGKTWRIIRINADGSLRLLQDDIEFTGVWDDRYNIDRESSTGINDYSKSRLKDGLAKIYNEMGLFDDEAKSKINLKSLCIGKRYIEETNNSGSIECSNVVENQPVGLMQVNEFMVASLDENCVYADDAQCANYNYLAKYTKSTWTLNADASNTHKAFKFTGDGFSTSTASNESGFRLVIYLSDNLLYTDGDGTLENPYIVK